MAVLMPTFGEKFRSLIKCCILWMKEDVNLFTDAESANFGDGIVGGSSLDYIPFDVVWYAVPYEAPDICTECGPLVLLIQCVHVRIVLVHPGLEWVVSGTSVGLPVAGVSSGDSCPVHHIVHLAANAWEDSACFRLFQWSTSAFEGLGSCSIIIIIIVDVIVVAI